MPDVPLEEPAMPKEEKSATDPTVDEAKLEMSSRMEHGGAPYDFSASIGDGGNGAQFSSANVAAGVAFIGLIGIFIIAGKMIGDLWTRLDSMSVTVSELSDRVTRKNVNEGNLERSLVRAELITTIQSLERAAQLGDPEITAEALALKKEAEEILSGLEAQINPAEKSEKKDAPKEPDEKQIDDEVGG